MVFLFAAPLSQSTLAQFVNGLSHLGELVAIQVVRQKVSMKLMSLLIIGFLMPYLKTFAEPQMLSQIPEQDRIRIEKLFSYLILDEGFGYTLFGTKPMATIGHDKKTPSEYREKYYSHPLFELESWWKTWEQYCHFFPMKDFIFFSQNGEDWFEVFLINKPMCLKIIEENIEFFRRTLSLELDSNELLEHILSQSNFFEIGLQKNQALYGLLLGYGKKNSIGFENYFSKGKRSLFFKPRASSDLFHLEEKELILPSFSSFSFSETHKLLRQYNLERDQILGHYSKGNFLEVTRTQLMSAQ